MSFTVQYLPLKKIKPDLPAKLNENIKHLRHFLLDCMYLLVVKKNQKEDSFFIISGHERYEYLRKHTNKTYVPCILVDHRPSLELKTFIHSLFPHSNIRRITPASWSILRTFLKQESRFADLSLAQQIKVLLLGIRYKRTVVESMKAMVHEFSRK